MTLTQKHNPVNVMAKTRVVGKYAPYWETENTLNPIMVQGVNVIGDYILIKLPTGHEEWVNCHKLGTFRGGLAA